VLGLGTATVLGALTWDGEARLVPGIWYLLAIVGAAFVGGLLWGVIAALGAGVLLGIAFTTPTHTLRVSRADQLPAIVVFTAGAVVVCLLIDRLQRATRRALDAAGERVETLARLDSLFANAPVGLAFLDLDLRFVRVNEALASITGHTVENHLGRTLDEVVGSDASMPLARQVRDSGRPALTVPLAIQQPGRRGQTRLVASFYPLPGAEGRVDGVGVILRDVTAQTEAEADRELLFDRVTRLGAVTAGLAAASSTAEVSDVILVEGCRAAGAELVVLAGIDPVSGAVEVLGARGLPQDSTAAWLRPEVGAGDGPHLRVARTGVPMLLPDAASIAGRYPDMARHLAALGVESVAVLPLAADGGRVGSMGLGFARDHVLDGAEHAFLGAFAGLCAAALERARLYDAEQRARAAAEAANDRLAFLAEATRRLTSTLDYEHTLREVAAIAVPRVADQCIVFLLDEHGAPRPFEVVHRDPERARTVRAILERYPVDPRAPGGIGAAIRRGVVQRWTTTEDDLRLIARDDEHLRLLRSVSGGAGIVVPMTGGGRILGAIALATDMGREVGAVDATLAEELAVRAAQAVANARLFQDRAHVAEVLQRSLLPTTRLAIPGVDVATRFAAGGEGVDVGGDFYDVFVTGRSSDPTAQWMAVIGDVRGKGVEAAALTATARNTIRSAALLRSSPAEVLDHLNEVLMRAAEGAGLEDGEPRFCTAVAARVETHGDSATVVIASGGHPLPFLLQRDGAVRQVGVPGTLLGVVPVPALTDSTIELLPGDAIVLYTDGVTERHEGDQFFDEEGLGAVLARCAGFTAAAIAERIETAARVFVENELSDDLAIMVIRLPARSASSTSASTDLPPEPASARRARRFVTAALDAFGAQAPVSTAELLVSELVTNAVVHGRSDVRVTVEANDGTIRISVYDDSRDLPTLRVPHPFDESGRGMYLVEHLAERWGVEQSASGKCVWVELPTGA